MAKTDWDERVKPAEMIGGERRSDRRYNLRLDVRWKLIRRRRILEAGQGFTIDFSSGGVLFETERAMPVGLNVELSVSWPVLLHNVSQLQLVVSGKVVRSQGRRTAIRMTQHEFRTLAQPIERRNTPSAQSPLSFFSRPALARGR